MPRQVKKYQPDKKQVFIELKNAIKDVSYNNADPQKFYGMLDKAIKDGFPIDYVPDSLYTRNLLCCAIKEFNTYDIAERLIDMGADVNAMAPDIKENALLAVMSVWSGEVPMSLLKKIISLSENLEITNISGYTPLETLCIDYMTTGYDFYKEKIRLLIENGAKPEVDEAVLETLLDEPEIEEELGYDQSLEYLREIMNYLHIIKEQKDALAKKEGEVYDYSL